MQEVIYYYSNERVHILLSLAVEGQVVNIAVPVHDRSRFIRICIVDADISSL